MRHAVCHTWAYQTRWSNDVCLCVCLDVNQGGTNHNCCTQRLVMLHAQAYQWALIRNQKPGRPDLVYGVLGHRRTYMCIISASYWPTLTKFAPQVHLTWIHQLTDSPRSTYFLRSQESKSNKCLANAKRPCDCRVLCLHLKSSLCSCANSISDMTSFGCRNSVCPVLWMSMWRNSKSAGKRRA